MDNTELEPTAEQLKSLCVKFHALTILYASDRKILARNPGILEQQYKKTKFRCQAQMPSQLNVVNEGSPRPLPQFDVYSFVHPDSCDNKLELLANSIEKVSIEIKPAFDHFNLNDQTFNEDTYFAIPLGNSTVTNHNELSRQIEMLTQAVNILHTVLTD